MRFVFADTSYWIALTSTFDRLHSQAVEMSKIVSESVLYTSEAVLLELLDGASARGLFERAKMSEFVEGLTYDSNIHIISVSAELFGRGLQLFKGRLDKSWSMTDCISMALCEELNITEVLTHDHHFVQAGFVALLRQ